MIFGVIALSEMVQAYGRTVGYTERHNFSWNDDQKLFSLVLHHYRPDPGQTSLTDAHKTVHSSKGNQRERESNHARKKQKFQYQELDLQNGKQDLL